MLTATNAGRPRGTKRRGRALLLALLLAALAPATAGAVLVDVGEASGTVGDVVTVPVTVEDLTGLGVVSYELDVSWYQQYATFVGAETAGTLSESWGAAVVNSGPGWARIAVAGAAPLSGAGTLVELQFELGPSHGNATLYLDGALFNEGEPPAETADGGLSIAALPVINIGPDTGEIAVGETLAFDTWYGTPPYVYGSTDPAVAVFTDDALLGLAPGSVRAFVEDAAGVQDTTTGFIDVRALRLEAGDGAGMPGDLVLVPMTISDPSPYGITAAEFSVTYNESYLTATGASTAGTLAEAAGWAAPAVAIEAGRVTVSLAGTNPLPAAGTLIHLEFLVDPVTYSSNVTLAPVDGLFNEAYPPRHVNGSVQVTAFPVITVYPDQAELVVGDTRQFSVSGAGTPPYDWSVTDPAVAGIDATGLLTALAPGATRVAVADAVGATDTTGLVTVCDLYLIAPRDTISINTPSLVAIAPDRDVTGLGIYGFELALDFNPAKVQALGAVAAGASCEPWGAPVVNIQPGHILVVHAGMEPLAGDLPLVFVEFIGTPELYGSSTSLDITEILFNEGTPCALVIDGMLELPTAAPPPPAPPARLLPNFPNPFNPGTSVPYRLAAPGRAVLRVHDLGGSLVRVLVDRRHEAAGDYTVRWDGRDESGRPCASGVYHCILETERGREARKMVLVK